MSLDCFRLLAEMDKAGMCNAEVARRLQKPATTIQRWKDGAEPGYTDGCNLVELHVSVTVNIRKSVCTEAHTCCHTGLQEKSHGGANA